MADTHYMETNTTTTPTTRNQLLSYPDGETIRPATREEWHASVSTGDDSGVITIDHDGVDVLAWVDGDEYTDLAGTEYTTDGVRFLLNSEGWGYSAVDLFVTEYSNARGGLAVWTADDVEEVRTVVSKTKWRVGR